MTDKLKPCPFCGSKEVGMAKAVGHIFARKYQGKVRAICCKKCGVNGGIFNTLAMSVEEAEKNAIQSWNRRADGDRLAKEMAGEGL